MPFVKLIAYTLGSGQLGRRNGGVFYITRPAAPPPSQKSTDYTFVAGAVGSVSELLATARRRLTATRSRDFADHPRRLDGAHFARCGE